MSESRIREVDDHRELLARGGLYSQLYQKCSYRVGRPRVPRRQAPELVVARTERSARSHPMSVIHAIASPVLLEP